MSRRSHAELRRTRRRRLPAWLRPRRTLRPSRAGWLYVALTFGVGFAALNTGNNLLYLVLSLMLAFLVLSGFLSESALRGVRIERRLPRDVYAARRNRVRLRIHNGDRRLASFALVVEDRITVADGIRAAGRVFALRIDPGATAERDYALVPSARGPLVFESLRLSTRFPFGLFVKSIEIPAPAEVLVYPAIESVRTPSPRVDRDHRGESELDRKGEGVLVIGLREHVPGDGLRRIAWRQSARRGALFVGESEQEQIAEIEVELPAAPADARPDDVFERHVIRAASEVVHHLDAGLRVGLRTHGESFAPGQGRQHRSALLRHLALIEASPVEGDAR